MSTAAAFHASLSPEFAAAVKSAPYLSKDDEAHCARAWREREDRAALSRLIVAHGRLALKIARGFSRYGLPADELVQQALLGFVEAARRFDPDKGFRFCTYATWWARATCQQFVLDNWSSVRGGTGAKQKTLFFGLRSLTHRLEAANPGLSSGEIDELAAKALDVARPDLEAARARSYGDVRLDAPLAGVEGATLLDTLADGSDGPDRAAEDGFDGERRRLWIAAALRRLDPRDRIVLERRAMAIEPQPMEDLARELGISRERVRQLEARALKKVKAALLSVPGLAEAHGYAH